MRKREKRERGEEEIEKERRGKGREGYRDRVPRRLVFALPPRVFDHRIPYRDHCDCDPSNFEWNDRGPTATCEFGFVRFEFRARVTEFRVACAW
jgi:hypothetical protein